MDKEITYCELREKEVINTVDGKKLGRTMDLVFTYNGKILGLVVPGEKKSFRNMASGENLFIPWKCIVKIGDDTVLVSLTGDRRHDGEHDHEHNGGHNHEDWENHNCDYGQAENNNNSCGCDKY